MPARPEQGRPNKEEVMRRVQSLVLCCAFSAAASPALGQFLMIPDSGAGDRVMLFSEADGSVIDLNWITDAGAVGWAFTTPKEAMQVGNQVWVSDQITDAVHRFDLNRNFQGSITAHPAGGNLDNIRGFGFDGSKMYLSVFTSDTARRGIAVYDSNGGPTGFFPNTTASYFDVAPFMGNILTSNSTTDSVERRNAGDGSFIANFATGIDFVQQVETLADNSVLAVSTIGANGIEGVYHFNSDMTLRRFINTQGIKDAFGEQVPRAAWLLGDGEYLITTSIGIYKTLGAGFMQIQAGVDGQFINRLVPAPGAVLVGVLGVVCGTRRRRA
jgi:hypothetical protein